MADSAPRSDRLPSLAPDDEPSLASYVPMVLTHVRMVTLVTVIAALTATAWVWDTPLRYRAAARLVVTPPRVPDAAAEGMGISVNNFRTLLEGDRLVSQVIAETGLDKPPYNLTPSTFRRAILSIQTLRDTRIIEVAVTLRDAAKAAEVAGVVCRIAMELWQRLASGEGASTRDALTKQIGNAGSEYDRANAKVRAFLRAERPEQAKVEAELYLEHLKRLKGVSQQIAIIEARNDATAKGLNGQEKFRTAPQAIRPDEAEIALRDEAVSAFINPTYEVLARELAQGRVAVAGLRREEQELTARVRPGTDGSTPLTRQALVESTQARLLNQEALARQTTEALASLLAGAEVSGLQRAAQVQILDEPRVPDEPLPRLRLQRVAAASGVALVLAALVAVFLELFRFRRT